MGMDKYVPEFSVILCEDGDDRTLDPVGELYADHATLLDYDFRIVEWKRDGDAGSIFSTFDVVGSDLPLTKDDEKALGGYRVLTDAIEFARTWYLARLADHVEES